MFLHTCQTAEESLSDDEFIELELRVLDDYFPRPSRGGSSHVRKEHLEYLAALHYRGESKLSLELLDTLLAQVTDQADAKTRTSSTVELLILRGELLMEMSSLEAAESTLQRAAAAATCAPMIAEAGALHAQVLARIPGRTDEALAVLQATSERLSPEIRPTKLVTSLAAAHAKKGEFSYAEEVLLSHICSPQKTRSLPSDEISLCRVQLASLQFEQGKFVDLKNTLAEVNFEDVLVPGTFKDLSNYFIAAHQTLSSGKLLSDSLRPSSFSTRPPQLAGEAKHLFDAFNWLRFDEAANDPSSLRTDWIRSSQSKHLYRLFHGRELELQGYAYGCIASQDYLQAVEAFQRLEALRGPLSRSTTFMAALDSRALTFALIQAGHSGALNAARRTRRLFQRLFGLRTPGTLWAVLTEARVLMDCNEASTAEALVQSALSQAPVTAETDEVFVRLKLILMEVSTRSGRYRESLEAVESFISVASSLGSVAPDLESIIKYQEAAALAASGDYDRAEHKFSSLCRDLEYETDAYPELIAKARYGLGRVLQHRGEYTHALAIYRSIMEAGDGVPRPLSLRTRGRIASCLTSLHEYTAAADVLGTCADDLSKWVGKRDAAYLSMRLDQADCMVAAGQYVPARRIYRATWDALHNDFSDRERIYIRAVIGNASCLRRLNDYAGAVLNYSRVHDLEDRAEHMSLEETLELQKWLAWSLEMTGNRKTAAQHYNQAIQLINEIQGDRTDLLEDLRFRVECCLA